MDKKYWDNPEKFDINHFLDKDGKFRKNQCLSTFGFGRRSCPGITLAMRMMYVLIGKMMLNYRFYVKGETLPKWDWYNGATLFVVKR